jgi:hypothetical protein
MPRYTPVPRLETLGMRTYTLAHADAPKRAHMHYVVVAM